MPAALARMRADALEEQHRRGYERYPVTSDEAGEWQEEQVWPD